MMYHMAPRGSVLSQHFPVDFTSLEVLFQCVLVPLPLATLRSLAMTQLGVEHLFRNTSVLHPHTVASPAKLVLHDLCLDTGGAGCREHVSVGAIVVPPDMQDPP